jgi:hypothetical protein
VNIIKTIIKLYYSLNYIHSIKPKIIKTYFNKFKTIDNLYNFAYNSTLNYIQTSFINNQFDLNPSTDHYRYIQQFYKNLTPHKLFKLSHKISKYNHKIFNQINKIANK